MFLLSWVQIAVLKHQIILFSRVVWTEADLEYSSVVHLLLYNIEDM